MAVQVDSGSQIDEFLRVFKRRIWWVLIPAILVAAIGISYAVLVPKKYVASTRLMVHDTRSDAGVGKDSTAEGRVAEHTIKARRRIYTVLDRLGWEEWLNLSTADKDRYIEDVIDNLKVETPPIDRNAGQQLVRINYAHTEPQKAYDFLEQLTSLWKDEVLEKNRNTLKEALEKTETSRRDKERESADLAEKIATIRQTYGIRPGSSLGGFNQGPTAPEFEQLDKTRAEIDEVTELNNTAALKVDALVGRYTRLDNFRQEQVESKDDRPVDPQIAATIERITAEETLIEEKGWLPENSRRKKSEREIQALKDQLFALREAEGPVEFAYEEVENPEKIRLGEQIDELDLEIDTYERRLEILRKRELELASKVQELQRAFSDIDGLDARRQEVLSVSEDIAKKFWQLKSEVDYLEGPAGNPFSELEKVHASTEPKEPDPILISVFSIFGGLALGLGLAIILEFSKSVFRSVSDISRVMTVPVLGTVNTITTRSEARRAMLQRSVMSASTLAFVGLISYLLWAYTSNRELLSDGMLENMTRLREALK